VWALVRSSRSGRGGAASVTVEDVALRAGVSRATVSRVVNGSLRVSPEKRRAVEKAVEELRYVPNPAARALMTRRSDSVAVVILESANRLFDDPFFNHLLMGISAGLAADEVQLVLLIAQSGREEERLERYIAAGHVDGAMMIGPRSDDAMPQRLIARGVPIVVSGRPSGSDGPGGMLALSYVDVENREGARAAVAHLVAGGRRRVAAIHGPLDLPSGRDRLNGYREALRAAGIRPEAGLERSGEYLPAVAAEEMRAMLNRHPDIDAVFAASDSMAAAVMGVLIDSGRRVPADVAVVGFDDSPVAVSLRPALTTVRQPIAAMGREMARLLMRQINEPGGAPSRVIFPTELIVRESSITPPTVAAPPARSSRRSGSVTPPASAPPDAGA
jgi:DNA-binding LacI/PurR family transcriptional regulator